MKYPNLRQEKKLWKKGFKRVVGLDESGRGPLAGPVVAAAVLIKNSKFQILNLKQIPNSNVPNLKLRDSKRLSPKKREEFYKLITKNPFIEWGIGRVSEKVIDKINILEATKLAMVKALKNLERKSKRSDFLIIDGNFTLPKKVLTKAGIKKSISQKSIINGDEKVFSCACASVIAKVYRDRIMKRYRKKYPQYGFDKHKGYPTKFHLKMLKKYGPCKIHRKSFGPVRACQRKKFC